MKVPFKDYTASKSTALPSLTIPGRV